MHQGFKRGRNLDIRFYKKNILKLDFKYIEKFSREQNSFNVFLFMHVSAQSI